MVFWNQSSKWGMPAETPQEVHRMQWRPQQLRLQEVLLPSVLIKLNKAVKRKEVDKRSASFGKYYANRWTSHLGQMGFSKWQNSSLKERSVLKKNARNKSLPCEGSDPVWVGSVEKQDTSKVRSQRKLARKSKTQHGKIFTDKNVQRSTK